MSKLQAAAQMLRSQGAGELLRELRVRAARALRGTKISDQFTRFAYYKHADGSSIPLYAGYRENLKPLHVLSHADTAGVARYVRDNVQGHMHTSGLGGAASFVHRLTGEWGVSLAGKTVLDVGCGDGALAYTLCARGAATVHGVELEHPKDGWTPEHAARLIDRLTNDAHAGGVTAAALKDRVKLYVADIQDPTITERFDLIVSNSVLEHVVDLPSGLKAMKALLKPGGMMVHLFNPFFSENGGHEWCILDFPWGHVRLNRAEIADYLSTYRAWEKEEALRTFDSTFNDPKLTLDEIDASAEALGLRRVLAGERRSYWWQPDMEPELILAQCRRTYPSITWRDLTGESVLRAWTSD